MGKRSKKIDPVAPTPEQMGRGVYAIEDVVDRTTTGRQITIGKAYRRTPVIDTLAGQGFFSTSEHKALRHYRHHADIVERSPVRDSLCVQRHGGSGTGPTLEMLNAARVVADCEKAAGSLRDILRAVVVDDVSLSQWAMQASGASERCRDRKGRRVCTMEPSRKALDIAVLEIKMVAKRVQAELDA